MANSDKSNLKTIASIIKRQKTGAVFSIIVDNALYGLDKPKIAFKSSLKNVGDNMEGDSHIWSLPLYAFFRFKDYMKREFAW